MPRSLDSRELCIKIIETVKQHPVLYISEIKGNSVKLPEFRQKVWKRISEELYLDRKLLELNHKFQKNQYS